MITFKREDLTVPNSIQKLLKDPININLSAKNEILLEKQNRTPANV